MRLDASSLEKYDTSSQNWLIFSKAGIWLVPFQLRTRKGACPTTATSLIQKLWLLGRELFRNRSLKCKCILCSRTDALGDGGGRGGGMHSSPLSQGCPLRCHPSFLPMAPRTAHHSSPWKSLAPTALGAVRNLTLPQDLAVPAGKGSFKQPICFAMKAFSRQALGRARPGLYRRGAALSFGVSGGEFQGTYRSHRKPEQYCNLAALTPAFISKLRISLSLFF